MTRIPRSLLWQAVPVAIMLAVVLASATLSLVRARERAALEHRGVVVDATITNVRLDPAGREPRYRVDYTFNTDRLDPVVGGSGWIPATRIDTIGTGDRLAVIYDPHEPQRSEPLIARGEASPSSPAALVLALAVATGGVAALLLAGAAAWRSHRTDDRLALGRH